jgi:hypothetical protein
MRIVAPGVGVAGVGFKGLLQGRQWEEFHPDKHGDAGDYSV